VHVPPSSQTKLAPARIEVKVRSQTEPIELRVCVWLNLPALRLLLPHKHKHTATTTHRTRSSVQVRAMASASRLDRLAKLVQKDINVSGSVFWRQHVTTLLTSEQALPFRPLPPEPTRVDDDDESGGVLLEEPQLPLAACSKQLATSPHKEVMPVSPKAQPNTDRRFLWIEGAVSSYNPGKMSKVANPPPSSSPLPSSDLNRGDPTAPHHHFTPILALAKYPYRFCNKSHSQDIASAFFDAGKFWKREWDL
jgi:hypothetical protein